MGAARAGAISYLKLRVRNCVVFDWSEVTTGSPPGFEIAVLVRRAFRTHICTYSADLRQRREIGWEFETVPFGGAALLVVVQRVNPWLVTLGPIPRGRKGPAWPRRWRIGAGILAASRAIHAFLAGDSSFRNVRWYTGRELAERHENPAAGSPEPGRV